MPRVVSLFDCDLLTKLLNVLKLLLHSALNLWTWLNVLSNWWKGYLLALDRRLLNRAVSYGLTRWMTRVAWLAGRLIELLGEFLCLELLDASLYVAR